MVLHGAQIEGVGLSYLCFDFNFLLIMFFSQSIFVLLALLLKRHVKKMHLCLRQEIDSRELGHDANTVKRVVRAVWKRFVFLKGVY